MANQGLRQGSFVPTTNVWDVNALDTMDVNSKDFKLLLVRLYQNISDISHTLNQKEGGYYTNQQYTTGALWFPNPANDTMAGSQKQPYRQENRIVIKMPTLMPGATVSAPHGLALGNQWTFTQIYGATTNPTTLAAMAGVVGLPIPNVDPVDPTMEIGVTVDFFNVNVTAGANAVLAQYTQTYIVLKFLFN